MVVGNRKKLKHNAVPILIHSVRQISKDEQLQAQREIHPNSMNHPISNSTAFPISLATGQANSNVCPEIVHLSTTTKDTNQANQDAEDSDDCITVQVNMRDFGEDKESSDLSPHQTLILENIQLKSENQELKSQINQLKCRLFLLEKQVSQLGKIPENRNTHVKLTLNNHSPAIHSNK